MTKYKVMSGENPLRESFHGYDFAIGVTALFDTKIGAQRAVSCYLQSATREVDLSSFRIVEVHSPRWSAKYGDMYLAESQSGSGWCFNSDPDRMHFFNSKKAVVSALGCYLVHGGDLAHVRMVEIFEPR